jgi:predicted Zn-dependent protease
MDASNQHSPGSCRRYAVSFTAMALLLLVIPSLHGAQQELESVPLPDTSSNSNPPNTKLGYKRLNRAAVATPVPTTSIGRLDMPTFGPLPTESAVGVPDQTEVPAVANATLSEPSPFPGLSEPILLLPGPEMPVPESQQTKGDQVEAPSGSLATSATGSGTRQSSAPAPNNSIGRLELPTFGPLPTEPVVRASNQITVPAAAQSAPSEPSTLQGLAMPIYPPPLPEIVVPSTQQGKGDQVEVPPEQRAILGAGRAAAARGDLKVAIGRFQEYLSSNPKDLKVRQEFTGILVRAKEWKQAIAQYELLLQALPDDTSILLGIANVQLQLAQPKLAIPHLLAALKASPNDTEIATQLARAYLGYREPQNARRVFDSVLSSVRPTDAKIPPRFGRLLLDLNRPRQALPFLNELAIRNPNDIDLLPELILANGWLGNYDDATRLIGEFAGREPRDAKLRVDLGDALFRISEFKLASLVYSQALQIERNNAQALLGMARVEIQLYEIESAAKLIEACDTATAPPALLALARGELHLAVGTYAEAIHVLRAYLERDEDDVDCRATLAKVYEATTDYEKAKAQWASLGLERGENARSASGVALILASQRLFAESNALCNYVLAEEPDNAKAISQLIYNFGKMNQLDLALELGKSYIDAAHEHDIGVVFVGLTLGKALLEGHRFADALAIYEVIAAKPHGQVAATYFGLYYATVCLGHDAEGRRFLLPALNGSLRDRMELADMAAAFNVNGLVIELCNSVLATRPHYLPALLRRGQAELRVATVDANITATVNTACLILQISPTNVAGRLILARAFAVVHNYPGAFVEYDKLIKTDPNLIQVRKELARTMYEANAYRAGNAQYIVAEYPTGEEVLHDASNYLAHPPEVIVQSPSTPPPAWSPIALPSSSQPLAAPAQEARKPSPLNPVLSVFSPAPLVTPAWAVSPLPSSAAAPISRTSSPLDVALMKVKSSTTPGHAASAWPITPLPAENGSEGNKPMSPLDLVLASAKVQVQPEPLPVPRISDTGVSSNSESGATAKDAAELEAERQRTQKRVAIEVEARALEVRALEQEQCAMSLKDLRIHQAVDAYNVVLANQPDNTSAMSNLAEMYGALGLTRAVIGTTNEILAVDPYNRDAAVVLDWATMTLQPRAKTQIDLSTQQGRNGLASIELDKYTVQSVCPFGDEGDYVGLGYSRMVYVPHGYPVLAGDMPSLLFGKQIGDRMQFVSELNFETYPNRFSDRPTFNGTLTYDVNDCWKANVGGFLRNVAENGASIDQDIFRGGVDIGSTFHITREMDALASYRFSGYSDNNLEHEALARFIYRLTPSPCELKFISTAQFTSFDETNILSGTNSPELPGNVIPPNFRHPYFAPLDFFYFEERLAYKQTLSRDLFKYSDHCYFLLEYGLGIDNRETIYHNFRVGLNCDVNLWLRLGVNAESTISPVYKAGAGFAFIELRWPPF